MSSEEQRLAEQKLIRLKNELSTLERATKDKSQEGNFSQYQDRIKKIKIIIASLEKQKS